MCPTSREEVAVRACQPRICNLPVCNIHAPGKTGGKHLQIHSSSKACFSSDPECAGRLACSRRADQSGSEVQTSRL